MNTINKMLKWIGISEDEEDYIEETEMEEETETAEPIAPILGRRAKVSPVSGAQPSRVVVIQFMNFDDAKDAADHLKQKKPVVANLEKLDNDTTRRVVDFLSGAVYGVDGRIQNVSNRIFLITPHNVEVMGNFQDEIRNFPFVN